MKKRIKIGLFLSFVIFLVACKGGNEISNKISFEDILPTYYKSEKKAGYQIDKNTKYIRKNIFSIKSKKQNVYGFNLSSFNVKGKALLDQFPHAFSVDKDGSIYINNWTKQDTRGKLFDSEIIKISLKGKFLKKGKCRIEVFRGIYNFVKGYLFIPGSMYYTVLNSNTMDEIVFDSIDKSSRGGMNTDDFILLKPELGKLIYGSRETSTINLTSGNLSTNKLHYKNWSIYGDYNFIYYVREPSVFISKTTIEGFSIYTVGYDQFANKYFANAYYNQKRKSIDSLAELGEEKKHTPVDYILVQSKRNKKMWKLRFPYLYGKPDINAWGARTYHVTPSGIVYILNVHLKHGMHLDKYVPEPVAKKAGGADKAYY